MRIHWIRWWRLPPSRCRRRTSIDLVDAVALDRSKTVVMSPYSRMQVLGRRGEVSEHCRPVHPMQLRRCRRSPRAPPASRILIWHRDASQRVIGDDGGGRCYLKRARSTRTKGVAVQSALSATSKAGLEAGIGLLFNRSPLQQLHSC